MDPLINAAELKRQLDHGWQPVVIDASFDLSDAAAGERASREGHLPGAIYWHLDHVLSGPKTGRNGRHPLPDRTAFAACVGAAGITPSTAVVAYDRQGGVYAARVWWLLRWLGHADVAVLDGGVAAWRGAGGALSTLSSANDNAAQPAPLPYADRPALMSTVDAEQLLAQLGQRRVIDARAPERFRGDVEPLDAVAGHIPGALNRFYQQNLNGDLSFKPRSDLRAEFEDLLGTDSPERVIHQCGSGVTACHNLLAMAQAGLPGSVLYPGSWSEWCADPSRPVAVGG